MTNDEHPTDGASKKQEPELQVTSQPTETPSVDQKVEGGLTQDPIQATERFTATDQKDALVSGERKVAGGVPGTQPTVGSVGKTPVELRGQIAHFRVLEALGSGGFGTVVRAYDTQLDREVAVKIIRSRSLGNKQIARQFQEEARAAAQLRHPNIVTVHQSGEYSDDQVYIVYDYIRGPTLRDVLRKDGKLRTRQAVSIMARIARALGYAHAKGIVHRDVKPENVLIESETDEPHVADFGCALRTAWQADEQGTRQRPIRANNFVGTPVYFSPEQASGRSEIAAAPADVWALGVMLDELVTGDRSFLEHESDRTRLMNAIQHLEPTPIRQRAPFVDRDLAAIWEHCLSKDPQQRYATAAQLADDLENWQRGLPVSVRPLGVMERFSRWGKRNPGLAASLAAVFLAVSLGFAVSSLFYGRELLSKRDNVRNSIDRLEDEPPDGVASIITSLNQPYLRAVSEESLRKQWQSLQRETGEGAERKRFRIELALFSLLQGTEDGRDADAIRHRLIQSIYEAAPEELGLLLKYLPLRREDLRELSEVADNPQQDSRQRLRAICALLANAQAEPLPAETRQRFANKSAQFLQSELGQNTDLANWVPLLSPLRADLAGPLKTALTTGRESVGKLLYYFYRDDVDFLLSELPTAADDVMPDLLSNLSIRWQQESAESIWERLEQERVKLQQGTAEHGEQVPMEAHVRYGRAVARLWLAGLHATDEQCVTPIPLLNDEADPSTAAYVISRAFAYNVQLARLMAMLRASLDRSELAAARNYLLAISNYPPESELEQLTKLLQDCYQHPDSGLHLTAHWLMRIWQIAPEESTPDLSQYTRQRNWRVGPESLPMVRCPRNQPFKLGSTLDELALAHVENRSQQQADSDVYHLRQIPWQFEISAREVTARDYLKFLKPRIADLENQLEIAERENQDDSIIDSLNDALSNLDTIEMKTAEGDLDRPVTSVSWHDAIAYCTWLSQQEGLGLCYGTVDQIEKARQDLRVVPRDIRQTGYRLPLLSEWECACRANSTTIWNCGNDESLLGEYAIFRANSNDRLWSVASRPPNRWGLFDMLGNASEWTSNELRAYPPHQSTPYVERQVEALEVDQERLGIEVRGGNYMQTAEFVRSAYRESAVPFNAAVGIGFRIARTIDATFE